jgi:hypothetical protein
MYIIREFKDWSRSGKTRYGILSDTETKVNINRNHYLAVCSHETDAKIVLDALNHKCPEHISDPDTRKSFGERFST